MKMQYSLKRLFLCITILSVWLFILINANVSITSNPPAYFSAHLGWRRNIFVEVYYSTPPVPAGELSPALEFQIHFGRDIQSL